ncbi:1-deoxy-D-xylulose 5-phosphate reductoisomerase [Gammaproteobacteria bacterium]
MAPTVKVNGVNAKKVAPDKFKRIQGVTILGATGSIGISTLNVLARYPDRFQVVALAARCSVDRLLAQCRQFKPRYVALADPDAAASFVQRAREFLPGLTVLAGEEGLATVVALPEVDQVMAAIVGAAGLRSTLAAVRAGKRVLLANKESLVMAGRLFMDEVRNHGAQLLPVDSEHNAVFQCLPNGASGFTEGEVRRILLTASGGPFRVWPMDDLANVTPEQAIAHPNWVMGRKISVDSATMMNKGLEVIEACWLFDTSPDRIEVLIHPQSVIHSMVEYKDCSVLAQLGNPDMRVPIAHALAWPQRIESGVSSLDFRAMKALCFEPVDHVRFPCLDLAYQALRRGGTAPAVLNAANEVAVGNFLDRRIRFTDIARVVEATLTAISIQDANDLADVFAADIAARNHALTWSRNNCNAVSKFTVG